MKSIKEALQDLGKLQAERMLKKRERSEDERHLEETLREVAVTCGWSADEIEAEITEGKLKAMK